MAPRLHCLGFRDDIPVLLNEIDLLVHTARQEPLGRVLLEAAACGRPIIATKVGGTPEILAHDASALLVPPDDPDALTAAMQQMLDDPDLRTRLGNEARRTVAEPFNLRQSAANLHAFWECYL
jgi:glycosyltransferase involved in cell wall biosynthesis